MKGFHRFLSLLVFALVKLAALLPIQVLYFKASVLQFFAEKVLQYRRSVIVQNISRAFPEMNYSQIKALTHDFYTHFFRVFAEVIKSQGISEKDAKERFRITNPGLIENLHKQNINVIALGGHWGNWEWLSIAPLFFDFSVYTLYKPLSSGIMENLMGKLRSVFGLKLLSMQRAGRYILKKEDYPALYVFIGDQSPSHKDPEYCYNFLNQESLFFNGGAKLATATKSAVVYISMRCAKPGYYEVTFSPISMPDEQLKDNEILHRFVKRLEQDIKDKPEFWLWSHKRWKHKPDRNQ
jgi:KDO2-lipid IV(A) lauroyltransferase